MNVKKQVDSLISNVINRTEQIISRFTTQSLVFVDTQLLWISQTKKKYSVMTQIIYKI